MLDRRLEQFVSGGTGGGVLRIAHARAGGAGGKRFDAGLLVLAWAAAVFGSRTSAAAIRDGVGESGVGAGLNDQGATDQAVGGGGGGLWYSSVGHRNYPSCALGPV